MRERVAGLLHRTGALAAVMQLRRLAPLSTLSIVTYHHIAEHDPAYPYDPDVADASPDQFRRQMEALARHFTPIGIEELLRAVDGMPLPKNPVMVTFDDGYASCHDVALPILRAVGVRATFFIATSFVEQRRLYWWERIALLLTQSSKDRARIRYPRTLDVSPRDPRARDRLGGIVKVTPALDVERFLDELATALGVPWTPDIEAQYAAGLIMTWDQIRALGRAGMDVESHGNRHRVLQTLDEGGLRDELSGSRALLESRLGRPIRAIAYPVGRAVTTDPTIRTALRDAGYRIGFSNKSGANRMWPPALRGVVPLDPFDIRRVATERSMSDAMFLTQVAVPQFAYTNRHNH